MLRFVPVLVPAKGTSKTAAAAAAAKVPPLMKRCRVMDMDHGYYPPRLTLEVEGEFQPAPEVKKPLIETRHNAYSTWYNSAPGKDAAGGVPPAPIPLAVTVGLESSSLQRDEVSEGGPQPELARGILPSLSEADCCFYSSVYDPLHNLGEAELVDAGTRLSEEMQTRCGGAGMGKRENPGIVGLSNIGNTCFMASMLQCVGAAEPLTRYFLSPSMFRDVRSVTVNDWSTGGRLATAWGALLRTMHNPQGGAATPALVKEILAEKFECYQRFDQQDSTEFQGHFLGVLGEDVLRAALPKFYDSEGVEGRGRPSAEVANEAWANHLRREASIFTDLMTGQFHQQFTCHGCKKPNIKCFPFSSLQLPIPTFDYVETMVMPHTSALINTKLRVPDASKKGENTTVAEVACWLRRYNEAPGTVPACLTPEIIAEAQADPERVYRESGCVAVAEGECIFVKELKGSDSISQPGFSTVFYPLPKGCRRYVPLNLRVAWGDDEKQKSFFGAPLKHSEILYEPYLVPLKESATNKDVLNRIWEIMERFMTPAYRAAEGRCAENPGDYTVYVTQAVSSTSSTPPAALKTACAEMPPIALAYNDELFVGDASTTCLVLEASRPSDEWRQLHEFPTALLEGRKKLAFKDSHGEHPAQKNDQDSLNIYRLFQDTEATEVMSGLNEVYCSGDCKEHKAHDQVQRIWRLPPVLCIHLKRFKQTQNYGYITTEKLTDPVDFPITGLDLSPFLEGPKEVAAPPSAFAPDAAGKGQATLPPVYDLFAVSQHSGSLHGGHYTAHIQDYSTGKWFYMDGSL